ncbi:MAG: ferritin family protein [Bacteroidales bacterium]|nr:ferritin family protein [Bacteroidales bacterium]MCF8403031.1 ferritin family protein [Bacteroidales bacterium]
MKNFENVNDILDFAINEEQLAVDFYSELADNSRTDDMKLVFTEFAEEEIKHKMRLLKIKEEGFYTLEKEVIADLKISDYVVNVKPSTSMTYEEALILAMKKEKAAFKLYTALADRAPNTDLKNVFLGLAQEESKHKLRFEIEYDEYVLREN